MRRGLVVAVYFFARLVKHASPTVICCKIVVKKAAYRQLSQTSGNRSTAGLRLPPGLVRNDSNVQSASRILGGNLEECPSVGPRPGTDADRGSRRLLEG